MSSADFLSVEVVGDRVLLRNLFQLPDVVRQILGPKVEEWTEKTAEAVRENIEHKLSEKTGKLLAGVKTEVTQSKTKINGRVYISAADVPYAEAQEEGVVTPPHMIFPSKAKVLAFVGRTGDKVFAAYVLHPGGQIPAHHFMKEAYQKMAPEISKGIKKAVIDGIRAKMRERA